MSIEERVAYLEGCMEDHGRQTGELQAAVRESLDEMGRRFEVVDRNVAGLRRETATLRRDVSGHVMWLVGILVTSAVGTGIAIVVSVLRVR